MSIVFKDSRNININEIYEFILNRKRDQDRTEPSSDFKKQTRDYLEWAFNSFILKNFLAYQGQELYGWLALTHILPATVIIHEWHPLIKLSTNTRQIAIDLVEKSFHYAHSKGIKNIRVFIDVLEKDQMRFQEIQEIYRQARMKQTHIALCMENYSLSVDSLQTIPVPEKLEIVPLLDQELSKIRKCHKEVFEGTSDGFIASLDPDEWVSWNFFDKRILNSSSTVIKNQGEIIGFIAANDYGDYVELGPIGVLKAYRDHNLGKILMEQCLSSLIQQKKTQCYIEVSEGNIPAYNLYKQYGFTTVSKKYGFLHRNSNRHDSPNITRNGRE
ncbi:MAG: GNAT family N-acetyltransferase [Promethearchaeota archaeon]